MENASEALMMAFGILIFVLALTVAIHSFDQVKTTSDVVLYTKDEANYYEYEGATGKASENREVGLETIIPTLYKYYKENYTVLFRTGTYNVDEEGKFTGEFSNVRPLYIYTTPSVYKTSKRYLWGITNSEKTQSTYDDLMQKKYNRYFTNGYNEVGNTSIFSFDLEEETLRHEPWTGSYEKSKENIDMFLQGKSYINPNNGMNYIDYKNSFATGNGFIDYVNKNNAKFIETIAEYSYSSNQANDENRRRVGKHN